MYKKMQLVNYKRFICRSSRDVNVLLKLPRHEQMLTLLMLRVQVKKVTLSEKFGNKRVTNIKKSYFFMPGKKKISVFYSFLKGDFLSKAYL